MKAVRRSTIFFFLVVFWTAADYGQVDIQTAPDPCAGTMDPEMCFWSPMGAGGGGTFATCTRTDGCSLCNIDNNRCATATVDASCTCDNIPKPGAGPGITQCQESGRCTYKHIP